jgi:hypothetical protein
MPVWTELGFEGSTPSLPGVFAASSASGAGGTVLENVSGMERHGADVHGGRTALHVPSLPTSWFGEQRWMFLDQSWDFLFAGLVRE